MSKNPKQNLELVDDLERILGKYLENHRGKNLKNHHILDEIFPQERRIASIILGLQTSMGTTLWEPLARRLLCKNGYTIRAEILERPDKMPQALSNKIEELQERRLKTEVTMLECKEELRNFCRSLEYKGEFEAPPPGEGVDIWCVKDTYEYAFDIKTNQINQGGGKKLNRQLLEWYAYRFIKDPDVQFSAAIAFPFNPNKRKTWWQSSGSRAKPLQESLDALVENEFWDFCSGQKNTWEEIVKAFRVLNERDFGSKFADVFRLPK